MSKILGGGGGGGGPFMEVNRLPLWTELEQKIKYRIQEVSPVQVKGLVHSL